MTEQLKIVNLKCSNCGGALDISSDMQRFACGYCGSEQIVERRGGTIALRQVVDSVARVQIGTDKTAAELALVRLDKELGIARAGWQQAAAEVIRRKSSWNIGIVIMVFSGIVFFYAFVYFLGGIVEPSVGQICSSLTFAGGAIYVFITGLKLNAKAKESFSTWRSEFLNPHEKYVHRLELEIGKQRRLVHS